MCGRFTTTVDLEEIKRVFKLTEASEAYQPSYNTAPGQDVPIILQDSSRKLIMSRWGLVPFWAKDPGIGRNLINARAESLAEKPSFRQAFKNRRCLIPADSFFEWSKKANRKTPYRCIRSDEGLLALAGLWELWSPTPDTLLHSCTIITVPANPLLQSLHDRMPAILDWAHVDTWLDPQVQDYHRLAPLLKPYPGNDLQLYPVSPLVNSALHNTPQVIVPLVSANNPLVPPQDL